MFYQFLFSLQKQNNAELLLVNKVYASYLTSFQTAWTYEIRRGRLWKLVNISKVSKLHVRKHSLVLSLPTNTKSLLMLAENS